MKKTNEVNPNLARNLSPNKMITTRDLPADIIKPAKERVPTKIAVSTRSIDDVGDAQERKDWKATLKAIKKKKLSQANAKAKKEKK